jgi:type I restriction enzyme S subunit
VPCPSLPEQDEIVDGLYGAQREVQRIESLYLQKVSGLDDLKKSLRHQSFTGAL